MSKRLVRLLLALAFTFVIAHAPPAYAACHAFTIGVSPATVSEGGSVTVTVERDGAVLPSQVDVASVNESASSGQDYTAVHRTISFTDETQQTFTVTTLENATHESTETFRLHLGNGDGCFPTSEFSYGSDARITISDDDPSPSPSPTRASSPSPTPRATPPVSPTPTATATPPFVQPSLSPTPSPEQTPADTPTLPEPTSSELAAGPGDRGPFSPGRVVWMVVGALFLTAAAGGLLALYRGRPQL